METDYLKEYAAFCARMRFSLRIGVVLISGAELPKDAALPAAAVFVSKGDAKGVLDAVESCMARWKSKAE